MGREMKVGVEKGNMKSLCDACETAPAIVFCPADEAALCRSCDHMVHTCNKLASRHLRVGLANPSPPLLCDICENAAAFFFCEVDGISLCLQCDMIVHVGGKRTHSRFIILRQRIEFPEEPVGFEVPTPRPVKRTESKKVQQPHLSLSLGDYTTKRTHKISPVSKAESSRKAANKAFDLNRKPRATSSYRHKKQC